MADQPLGVITNSVAPIDQTGFQQTAPTGQVAAAPRKTTPPLPPAAVPDQPPAVISGGSVKPVDQTQQDMTPGGQIRDPLDTSSDDQTPTDANQDISDQATPSSGLPGP